MALKKNDFLDASDSEEDVQGYDSDDDLKKGGRVAKRRRIDESDDDDAASDSGREDGDAEEPEKDDTSADKEPENSAPKKKKLKSDKDLPSVNTGPIKKNLVVTEEAIRKSGVIYISRIPPFMKPQKLRSLLEPYGKINRTFLAPEDPAAHARRVRGGGNKKRLFTEGWVEFVKKKDAKAVCELLNTRIIGGKKGNYYHDDIWNMMYLKGFKWHNLTEQIAGENAERESRMRAEISKSTKENKEFVRNVERAKMLDGIQAKAKAKKRKTDQVQDEPESQGPRSFKQTPLINKGRAGEAQPEQVTRVLSKIF
ncbi:RNA-binding ATPase activator esf2 [Amphichorda felina]